MRGLTPYQRFRFLICILPKADLSMLILQIHCNSLLLKGRVVWKLDYTFYLQ